MVFINVNYPINVVGFFNLFAVSSFSFIPDPFQLFFPSLYDKMQTGLSAPQKILDNDMDGRFLNNNGVMAAIWGI